MEKFQESQKIEEKRGLWLLKDVCSNKWKTDRKIFKVFTMNLKIWIWKNFCEKFKIFFQIDINHLISNFENKRCFTFWYIIKWKKCYLSIAILLKIVWWNYGKKKILVKVEVWWNFEKNYKNKGEIYLKENAAMNLTIESMLCLWINLKWLLNKKKNILIEFGISFQ